MIATADSSAKDITECDIYAFSLDTCYGFDQVDAFPIMSVSGGLTIGMDEQSAVATPLFNLPDALETSPLAVFKFDARVALQDIRLSIVTR